MDILKMWQIKNMPKAVARKIRSEAVRKGITIPEELEQKYAKTK